MQYLSVALGGALGALARFLIVKFLPSKSFPFAILTANALGSFLIGVLFVIIVEKSTLSETARSFLMVGFLGAFTTFSTFSLDNWQFLAQGEFVKAMLNIVINVVLGLLLVWLGVICARLL